MAYYPPQGAYPPQQHMYAPPPPSAAATPAVPYIGARISLVSHMGVRYEGTLYTIDTRASTVALQHVQCFGTENRPAPSGFVPPSSDIYGQSLSKEAWLRVPFC